MVQHLPAVFQLLLRADKPPLVFFRPRDCFAAPPRNDTVLSLRAQRGNLVGHKPAGRCASPLSRAVPSRRTRACARRSGFQKWLMLPSTARPETETAKITGQRRRMKQAATHR